MPELRGASSDQWVLALRQPKSALLLAVRSLVGSNASTALLVRTDPGDERLPDGGAGPVEAIHQRPQLQVIATALESRGVNEGQVGAQRDRADSRVILDLSIGVNRAGPQAVTMRTSTFLQGGEHGSFAGRFVQNCDLRLRMIATGRRTVIDAPLHRCRAHQSRHQCVREVVAEACAATHPDHKVDVGRTTLRARRMVAWCWNRRAAELGRFRLRRGGLLDGRAML